MELRVLGPLELEGVRGPVDVGTPKERALLAHLALHRNTGVSEGALIDALWDDDPPRTAGRTVQSYLSRIRKRLAEADPGGESLHLGSFPGGWRLRAKGDALDVAAVEGLVGRARTLAEDGDHVGAALTFREALGRWRGPALADLGDAAWVTAARARYAEQWLHVTEERVEAELACGRHADLVGELEALCAAHPTRERLWALLMLAQYRSGRQADALRAYQRLRSTLAEELGIDPSPSLAELEQRILEQDPGLLLPRAEERSSGRPTAQGAPPVDVPDAILALRVDSFVGRGAELEQLTAAWKRARSGALEVVLLAGEPGIGKTALAVQHAAAVADDGATVLFGRCDEEALAPFQPFVEALSALVTRTPPEVTRSRLGPLVEDLALLLPDLGRTLPEVAGVVATGADTERYRLFEAVPAFLRAVASDTPVVLVLDDLHWADQPTLQLLQHVMRRCVGTPMLVVGTYRDTDLVRTHPMAAVLADLRRADLVDRLPVRGLGEADVIAMVSPIGEPDEGQRRLARALWQETDGNPLFLREIVRHLLETDAVARGDDGGLRALRRIEQLAIPEGVREVIGRRLTRLSEEANRVLAAGSVMGREVRLDVLEGVLELPTEPLLDAVEEAVASGILTDVAGAPGRYAFTHALVRDSLYDELSITRRVRMHQRIGEAIEEIHGDAAGPHLAELAYHYAQAAVGGTAEKAIDYGRLAGDHARAQLAYEDALRHYADALEVAEDLEAAAADRADLLLAMADCSWRSAGPRDARAIVDRVLALDLDTERFARAALAYAGGGVRGWWVEIGAVEERAIDLLRSARAALTGRDSALQARVLVTLAKELAYVEGSDAEREHLTAEAVAMARRLGDDATIAMALIESILAIFNADTADRRVRHAAEARAIATRLGDAQLAGLAALHQAVGLGELDRIPESNAAFEEAGVLLDAVREPSWLVLRPAFLAGQAVQGGRFDEVERLAEEIFQTAQARRDPNGLVTLAGCLFTMHMYRGDVDLFSGIYAEARRSFQPVVGALDAMEVGWLTDAGRLDDAAERWALVRPGIATLPRNVFWLFALMTLARSIWRLRDEDGAAVLHDLLLPYEGQNAQLAQIGWGPVATALGWCDATLGRVEDAEAHLRGAMARCERNGWIVGHTEAALSLAALLAERRSAGSAEQAEELLRRSVPVAADLGLTSLVRLGEGVRATLDGRTAIVDLAAVAAAAPRPGLWQRVARTGRGVIARVTKGESDEVLLRQFGSPAAQRAVFTAMAAAYRPVPGAEPEADLVFELEPPLDALDPAARDWWTLEVRGRRATARRGRSEAPTTSMRLTVPDLVRLCSGESTAVQLILEGRVEITGDVLTAIRLPGLLGLVDP